MVPAIAVDAIVMVAPCGRDGCGHGVAFLGMGAASIVVVYVLVQLLRLSQTAASPQRDFYRRLGTRV